MSKSPSLRRIQADIRELSIDPSDQYHAAPLEHDMFEWHFTIRGASGTDFEGGVYHGKILLPPEYPFKPPNIVFLTPSGRFETNTKVCLSFSSFHPELWQPAWGIRLILEALISFLPTPADGAIGALDWRKEERVKLAKESLKFRCPVCCEHGKTCVDLLPEAKKSKEAEGKKKSKFQEEIEKLKMLQFQNHAVQEEDESKVKEEKSNAQVEMKTTAVDETESEAKDKTSRDTESSDTAESNSKQTDRPNNDQVSTSPIYKQQSPQTNDTSGVVATIQEEPNNTPAPSPPLTERTTNTERTAVLHPGAIENAPLVSDQCLNGMIALFTVVVIVLMRQTATLLGEMDGLEG